MEKVAITLRTIYFSNLTPCVIFSFLKIQSLLEDHNFHATKNIPRSMTNQVNISRQIRFVKKLFRVLPL